MQNLCYLTTKQLQNANDKYDMIIEVFNGTEKLSYCEQFDVKTLNQKYREETKTKQITTCVTKHHTAPLRATVPKDMLGF